MGYAKDREAFVAAFWRYFPASDGKDSGALLRAATSAQRYNEIVTSIDVGEKEMARLERADARRTERVRAICERIGATLEAIGDPRGHPYTLTTPDGRTLSVPGRGLPARCFR